MTQRIESVLSGGGEMGERMRAVDQACKAVSAMQPEFASSHADLSRAQPSPRGGAASTRAQRPTFACPGIREEVTGNTVVPRGADRIREKDGIRVDGG